jgi:rSAM/selenodomain-associated transferase 2
VIGVVIPTLDEEQRLPGLLGDLRCLARAVALDVVVADGGSSDATVAAAARGGARVLATSRGRAHQLNAGAAAAPGEWLLFLHADSRLPAAARRALLAALVDEPDLDAAVFRFAIDLPAPWKRFIELGQALRQRLYGLPYGDQGLLVRRTLFQAVGGYADLPLLEDVALIRALRRRGVAIRMLPAALVTSGRRYRAHGVVRTWLLNVALISLYLIGVPARRLARWRAG